MTRTLIVPGLNGSGAGHWQRWWLANDPEAHMVRQDDWTQPRLNAWLAKTAGDIAANPGAILVAHSLGCLVVAHLASRRELDIGGALLVAPADVDDPGWAYRSVAGFGPVPLNPLPFPTIVVASQNDPVVRFARAREFAEAWGARLVDAGFAGHINKDSGFGPWPQGLELAGSLRTAPSLAEAALPRPLLRAPAA